MNQQKQDHVSMWIAIATLVLLMMIAGTAEAQYDWRRVVDVPAVDIEIRKASAAEILAERRKHSGPNWHRDVGRDGGYAVLYRNKTTGGFRCVIWVKPPVTGTVLEHERRHCRGWVHD